MSDGGYVRTGRARFEWQGFEPDTSSLPDPVTPKKSPQDQLDDLDEQLTALEEKRKELQLAVAKEEVIEDLAEEQLDEEAYKKVHKHCHTEEEVEQARYDSQDEADEVWDRLQEFGAHTAGCLAGALTGSQTLHPLCTCGWNEVATQLERR